MSYEAEDIDLKKYPQITDERIDRNGSKKIKTTHHQNWIKDYRGIKYYNLTGICPTVNKDKWNGSTIWLWKCDCGKYTEISPGRVQQGHPQSCGCLHTEAAKLQGKLSAKNIANQRFGSLMAIKPTELRKNQKIVWECKCDCGNTCYVPIDYLTSLTTCSCGCNKQSIGERIISQLLKDNNIFFIQQKRFLDCKDKHTLPFDFYVENKYVIEFDGEQHYRKNSMYYSKIIQKHDKIKNDYCKNNNIPIIRIPYTHITKLTIKDLLLNSSNFIYKE